MGKLDFAQRLLSRFESRLDDDLEELEQQVGSGDLLGIARVAHRIKGASANIAAPRLKAQSADIEDLARSHQLDDLAACLEQIREEQAQFSGTVAAILSRGETVLEGAE